MVEKELDPIDENGRPRSHKITKTIVDVIQEVNGEDLSHCVGKYWFHLDTSLLGGEDVLAPSNLDEIRHIAADRDKER